MDEVIVIRQGSEADAAAIRDLTRAAYAKWIPSIGREPRPMAVDYQAAVQSHRFDLLYVDGSLAALIETVDEGEGLLVENLAVSPAVQGRGLGSRLMLHAEEIARMLGHERIRLYTNRRFTGNVEFYLSLGYRVDGEEPIDAGMMRTDMSKPVGRLG